MEVRPSAEFREIKAHPGDVVTGQVRALNHNASGHRRVIPRERTGDRGKKDYVPQASCEVYLHLGDDGKSDWTPFRCYVGLRDPESNYFDLLLSAPNVPGTMGFPDARFYPVSGGGAA